MSKSLTAREAIRLLQESPEQYASKEQLRELARRVDADAPGRLTILYSGPAAKGVWSTDVINIMIAADEDVRVINKSEAAQFLQSREFYQAVAKAHGLDDFGDLMSGTYNGPATKWLYHAEHGPWADASARFAESTRGEVRAIVGEADFKRTFAKVELPLILNNPHITSVEGIPRQTLLALQERQGTEAVFDMIVARSRERVSDLRVPVSDPVNHAGQVLRNDSGKLQIETHAWFEGTQVQGKGPVLANSRSLDAHLQAPSTHAVAGQQHLHDWHAQQGHAERMRSGVPGNTTLRAATGLGIAATLAEGLSVADRIGMQLAQDNPLAANSTLRHYVARGTGGWMGGALTGLAVGWETGPGAILFVAGGAVIGSEVGEKVATWWDNRDIVNQQFDGAAWRFNGHAWRRQDRVDATQDGTDNAVKTDVAASYTQARQLNYMATNVATVMAMGDAPKPRNPFVLPADEQDRHSLRTRSWHRDPDSGEWRREVVTGLDHRELPGKSEFIAAPPDRAAQLDAQAAQIIQANLANGPVAIAARYDAAYRQGGWSQFGPMPKQVQAALDNPDRMLASDGELYKRQADGQWRERDSGKPAQGNLAAELDYTRLALQMGLEQHAQAMAAMPPRETRTPDQQRQEHLVYQYQLSGIELKPEWLAGIDRAVRQTQAETGVRSTMLQLKNVAEGKAMADSPIVHYAIDADGSHRVVATTDPQTIRDAVAAVQRGEPVQPLAPAPALASTEPAIATLDTVTVTAPRLDRVAENGQGAVSPSEPTFRPDFRDPAHPVHDNYRQVLHRVHQMDERNGLSPGPYSEQLAAALLVQAESQRMRINHVELDGNGRAVGSQELYIGNAGPKVGVDLREAHGTSMAELSRQWLQARSPHLLGDSSVTRTAVQRDATLVERLPEADRPLFAALRNGLPGHISDAKVLEVLGNAKAAGIAGIERFGQMSLVGERVLVQGDIHSGFARCMTDVQSAAPDADRTLQTLRDQAAQREHAQAQAPALEPTR